jgi:micrococcal nuclease
LNERRAVLSGCLRAARAACAPWIGAGMLWIGAGVPWIATGIVTGTVGLVAAGCASAPSAEPSADAARTKPPQSTRATGRSSARGEPRRRPVEKSRLRFDDGDTLDIVWEGGTRETVRIRGIDTPEVAHPEHKLPVAQPYGERAAGFLEGCLARSERIELLDRGQKDPYGRTLGYLLLDGRNYSVLVLEAGLAAESVSHYGDNGFPAEAAACIAAAKQAGSLPFEAPHEWRKRFRVYVDQKAERERAAAR